ncbi:hypothetical protein JVX98_09705 [Ensifer sp. PDNC004]|nr:hypothetical protein JVX98_09705 [Ensifer sp. PDNC004]
MAMIFDRGALEPHPVEAKLPRSDRTGGELALRRDRTRDGVDHGAEFHDRAVAHELDDAPVKIVQKRIENFGSPRLDGGQRARLVGSINRE